MATDYDDGEHRIVGTSALSAIESFNRNRTRLDNNTALKYTRPRYVPSYTCLVRNADLTLLAPILSRIL